MNVANSIIRPYRPADLPALQQIRQAAFRSIFDSFRAIIGDELFSLALAQLDTEQAQLLERLCRDHSDHRVLVVTLNEKPVGFVSFKLNSDTRIGEIGLNAVHPDHAGRGIGTSMYRHVLAQMKQCGIAVATVGTGGDPSHAPARRAYQKAGFGVALPSVVMYRKL